MVDKEPYPSQFDNCHSVYPVPNTLCPLGCCLALSPSLFRRAKAIKKPTDAQESSILLLMDLFKDIAWPHKSGKSSIHVARERNQLIVFSVNRCACIFFCGD